MRKGNFVHQRSLLRWFSMFCVSRNAYKMIIFAHSKCKRYENRKIQGVALPKKERIGQERKSSNHGTHHGEQDYGAVLLQVVLHSIQKAFDVLVEKRAPMRALICRRAVSGLTEKFARISLSSSGRNTSYSWNETRDVSTATWTIAFSGWTCWCTRQWTGALSASIP